MRLSFWKRILLQLVLLILPFHVVHAASIPSLVLEDKPSCDLSGYMQIQVDPTTDLTVQQIDSQNDWTETVFKQVPNLGFTQAAIWIRFSLTNQAHAFRKFYVSFEYPVTNSVSFYQKNPNGDFQEEHTGSSVPASANVVPDRHFLFPLTIAQGETVVVYLRIKSTARMTLPIRVLSDRALLQKAIRDYTIYGALLSLLALVLVYFIAAGSFLHRRTSLWLVLYLIFFGLHTAIRGGFIHLLLPGEWLGITGILQLVVVAGLFFTGAKFFRSFLFLKNSSKVSDRIMMFFQYLSLTFVFIMFLPIPLIILITLLLIVINPIFSICLAFYFWRKGVPNAGYFATGWIVAHSVAVYDFFRINGVIPYSPLGEWPIPFSLLVALIFLSVALIRQNAADHIMAKTDPLTHLANRRKFDEQLHAEWNRCMRQRSPLSLVMADVDHFKKFNDSFGHNAGDKCLRHIADVLKKYTRRTGDLAVRYGGEEFVLLLPNLDGTDAFNLAEAVRKSVEGKTMITTGQHRDEKVTISLGVATTVPEEGTKPDFLVLQADRAMYRAKHGGRNCTVSSS